MYKEEEIHDYSFSRFEINTIRIERKTVKTVPFIFHTDFYHLSHFYLLINDIQFIDDYSMIHRIQ